MRRCARCKHSRDSPQNRRFRLEQLQVSAGPTRTQGQPVSLRAACFVHGGCEAVDAALRN